jgi:hypothetical protein
MLSHSYAQVDYEEWNNLSYAVDDTAQTFSWQNLSIPAHGSLTRSALFKFGVFESSPLSFDLQFSGVNGTTIYYRELIIGTGTLTGTIGGRADLYLVIDDDYTDIAPFGVSATINAPFTFNFTAEQFGVSPGSHKFAFYAVDSDGNVAPPLVVAGTVLAPTATATRSPQPSFSPSPYPTQTAAPPRPITCVLAPWSFNIYGYDEYGMEIWTTWTGYSALLRVGDDMGMVEGPNPARINDVTLSLSPSVITDNTVLLGFILKNHAGTVQSVDVGVSTDINFDGEDDALVSEIDAGSGFVVSSVHNAISFILRHSVLVTDVSTFWYGLNAMRWFNNWTQIYERVADVADSGITFSWQGISLLPGQEIVGSALVFFGVHFAREIGLTLAFPALPGGGLDYKRSLTINGTVTGSDPGPFTLIVAVDNLASVVRVAGIAPVVANQPFQFGFRAMDYGAVEGFHQFSFYAIDSVGNSSPLQSLIVTVIAPSATPTATASVSHSPSPSISPRVNVPIVITNATRWESFNVYGEINGTQVRTSFAGYTALLAINGDQVQMFSTKPANLSAVVLSLGYHYLSTNALLLGLQVENFNDSTQTVDVAITADILFGGHDDAPCHAIPGGHGFSMLSDLDEFTFITGGYSLVTDASTFWFGRFSNRSDNIWNQVQELSFAGADSAMAFSWQDIVLLPGQRSRQNVLMRFGGFETSHVSLTLTFPSFATPVFCHAPLAFQGVVNVEGSPTEPAVTIFLVVDGDIAEMEEIDGQFVLGHSFTLAVVPSDFGIHTGVHSLAFYAVDADGDVSEPRAANVTVTDEPTSQSPGPRTAQKTPPPSATSPAGGTDAAGGGVAHGPPAATIVIIVVVVVVVAVAAAVACALRVLRRRPRVGVQKIAESEDVTTASANAFIDDGLLPD